MALVPVNAALKKCPSVVVSRLGSRCIARNPIRYDEFMDDSLLLLFNQTWTHSALDTVMAVFTQLAVPVMFGLGALYWLRGRKTLGKAMTVGIIVGIGLAVLFQLLSGRPRPIDARLVIPQPNTFSLPSGHATGGFLLATLLVLDKQTRTWIKWSAVGLAILNAFTRLYLGMHYFSDVVAGTYLGIAVGVATYGWFFQSHDLLSRIKHLLWIQVAVMVLCTQMAYLGYLPLYLLRWPWADKVLHFLLVGPVVFWLHLWLKPAYRNVGSTLIPTAVLIALLVVGAEEILQILSPLRTADWLDFGFDLAGMLTFWYLANWVLQQSDEEGLLASP